MTIIYHVKDHYLPLKEHKIDRLYRSEKQGMEYKVGEEHDVLFRKWKDIKAGIPYYEFTGKVRITSVNLTYFGELTDEDAKKAGYNTVRGVAYACGFWYVSLDKILQDIPVIEVRWEWIVAPMSKVTAEWIHKRTEEALKLAKKYGWIK